MTKVIFLRLAPWMGVNYPHPQDIPYAFDIAQVVALLDQNQYVVSFMDGMIEKLKIDSIIKKIISINPQILALKSTSSSKLSALEVFKKLKELLPEVYIVAFGQHAHYSPQTFLNQDFHIDACVYGEPEITLCELIRNIPRASVEKNSIKGIYYWDGELRGTPERSLTMGLDQWPMPRYEIFRGHDYRIVSMNFPVFRNLRSGWILASRGCPFECTICSPAIRRSFGTRLRKHSPERVADSFKFLENKLGVNTISFGDDVFTLDMGWAEDVCDELIKRKNKIYWGMSTRADRLSSALIKKMREAGLRSVALGLESGSERVLKDIGKKITPLQVEWAVSEFRKNKISVNLTVIVGHVNETIQELTQTRKFLKRTGAFFAQLHYLSPYPGTKIADVFRERFISLDNISHFNAPPMNVSKISDKALSGLVQKMYLEYYFSLRFIGKYINQRLAYFLSNPLKELILIKESLAYFLLSEKNKA